MAHKLYTDDVVAKIVPIMKKIGVRQTQIQLNTQGIQIKPGKPKQTLEISYETLNRIAKKHNITPKVRRPVFFNKHMESRIVSLLRQHGRKETKELMLSEGIQCKPGEPKKPVLISYPTLDNIIYRNGLRRCYR